MLTQMLVGRILLLIICGGISYYGAFRRTPELNGVENAWIYRASYGMMILRGLAVIAFDGFGLFPLE